MQKPRAILHEIILLCNVKDGELAGPWGEMGQLAGGGSATLGVAARGLYSWQAKWIQFNRHP
jgi:hypothetical protein